MKVSVTKLDEAIVRRSFPIAGRVPGWFFQCREQSHGVWHAEGTDLWGRRVGTTDSDYDRSLDYCVRAAEALNAQLLKASG
jgi:hypothetical protein